jgi:hypothetical protein
METGIDRTLSTWAWDTRDSADNVGSMHCHRVGYNNTVGIFFQAVCRTPVSLASWGDWDWLSPGTRILSHPLAGRSLGPGGTWRDLAGLDGTSWDSTGPDKTKRLQHAPIGAQRDTASPRNCQHGAVAIKNKGALSIEIHDPCQPTVPTRPASLN